MLGCLYLEKAVVPRSGKMDGEIAKPDSTCQIAC